MKRFEEQFTAWVDGRLSDTEAAAFEARLADHPEAAQEKESAIQLGQLLREHSPAAPLGNADFFNHQLMQRIAAEAPRRAAARRYFWSIPAFAWAGVCCLAIALGLFQFIIPTSAGSKPPKSDYFAQVVESWPGNPNVTASTVYSPEDHVTVLWLDGMDYIPAANSLK